MHVSSATAFERVIDDFREELIFISETNGFEPRPAPVSIAARVRRAFRAMVAFREPDASLVDRAYTAVAAPLPIATFAELEAIATLAADDDKERGRRLSVLLMALSREDRLRLMWAYVAPAFVCGFVAASQRVNGK
jgi:hypothetical protein